MARRDTPEAFDGELGIDDATETQDPEATETDTDEDEA
jgi:hypothetical protein